MANNMKYHIKGRNCMRTVDVIFVSDELVGSTIVSKKEYERIMRQKLKTEADKLNSQKTEDSVNIGDNKSQKRKGLQEISEINAKRSKYIDDVELALAALENDDVEKITVNQPSTLFDEEDVAAKRIYNFENSVQTPKTVKPVENANNSKSKFNTNLGKPKDKPPSINQGLTQTPYTLRKKVIKDIKEIQKILENSDDDFSGSDSDESYKESDESMNESTDMIHDGPKEHTGNSKTFFENYCESQSTKKSKGSINTLNKLKTSKLTQQKLEELIKNFQISSVHKDSIKTLFNETLNLFNKWDFILKQNFNLLLYGAGSKREIVGKFVERFIDVHPLIVVNGFFPDITGKEIVEKICSILKIEVDSSDIVEKIQTKIKSYNVEIYLAINNIDGIMLRNSKVQNTLSQLGKLEQIHIIASIDHINAPLIWNKSTSSEFNWVWFDSTTFLNYSEETVYEGNIMLQNSGKATLSSLRNVFNSLTKNSQGIFMIILKNQLESGNNKSGISFRELYQECRKELLISSDVALRAQLKEFIDHLVLKQKRNADGEEQFVIVIESSILKQFLEEQEAQQN